MTSRSRAGLAVALLGAAIAAGGLVGLLHTAGRAQELERSAADAGTAAAVAGYFSLVIPVDQQTGDYRLASLLSESHILARLVGDRATLQVAWRTTPLLSDSLRLAPLPPATAARLADGYTTVRLDHPTGPVAIVPLLDQDQWNAVGWVAFRGGGEQRGIAGTRRALALGAAAAILLALMVSGSRVSGRVRRAPAFLAVGLLALLAVRLGFDVREGAARSTDVVLSRIQLLAERAATIPRVNEAMLARLAPGYRVAVTRDSAAVAGIHRVSSREQPSAWIEVPLRSGNVLRVSMVPREARLAGTWAALAGWVLLVGSALAIVAWAGPASEHRRRFRETVGAWGFIGPALAHLAVFSMAPVLFAGYLSLHRWGLVEPHRPFVGLGNYAEVLGSGRFWHSLGVTALYSLYVPVTMVLALLAAILLDRSGVRIRLARTLLFLPFISSVVAVAVVWQWMYQPEFGFINGMLARIGVTGPDWLGNPRTALPALMILSAWVHLGYQMVIFLAGLQGIPAVYHDAARVDGAGPWQRFRRITLPLLKPTLLFVLVTGTISSFQVFTYVSVMTEGGPLHATEVVVYRIYQEAWEFLRFGTASAMSLVLLALLLAVTWIQFRWLGRKVELTG